MAAQQGSSPDGDTRGTKRPADALDHDPDTIRPKHPRQGRPTDHPIGETPGKIDPVGFRAREGQWPREYFQPDAWHILAQKWSPPTHEPSRFAMSATPSEQALLTSKRDFVEG
ncbi:hypothetical protein IMZ48_15880, partial [Candidatus Bathyarchaeota archaeon]|nr:hypothetical protein [Candidatus Bathyarchaeota archaeon]